MDEYLSMKILWKKLKQLFCTNSPPGVIYRIVDLKAEKLEVVIKCLKTTALIDDKIPNIIKDEEILAGLEPIDACWLGVYYGRALNKEPNKKIQKLTQDVNFLLKNKRGRYRIHSLNRGGRVSYLDTETNVSHEEWPVEIAKNETLINQFDPSQACYIGILAGLQGGKSTSKKNGGKPSLMLVK